MKKRMIRPIISSAAALMVTASFLGNCLSMAAADDIELTLYTSADNDDIEVFTYNAPKDDTELLYNYMLTQSGVTPQFETAKNGKQVFYSSGISAGAMLTGNEAAVYKYVKDQIQDIAAGKRTSTKIEIPFSVFGIKDGPWTAEELGVTALISGNKIATDALNALRAKVDCDYEAVITAILADCPYDMYWCDKTSYLYSPGKSIRAEVLNNKYVLRLISCPAMTLYISADYAENHAVKTTAMPDARLADVTAAINNAQEIVDSNSDKYGKELMEAYRKAICDLADYNYSSGSIYGDPWQLIYVFDGDTQTNVVCEGYAKAFKYLCDLSADRLPDISCLIATGTSSGDPHMWNIVNMDDDRSYLVDVTYSDGIDREVREYTETFLLGVPTSGSYDTSYKFTFPGASFTDGIYTYTYPSRTYDYTFDDDTKAMYDPAYLSLSTEPYTETVEETPKINRDYSVFLSVTDKTYDGRTAVPTSYIYKSDDTNKAAVSISGAEISFSYYNYDGISSITDEYVNSLTAMKSVPKNAGNYIVKASAATEGYEFETVYSAFTIRQKEIALTPNVTEKTYGDPDPDLSGVSYKKNAVISGDTINISGEYALRNYNGNAGSYDVMLGTLVSGNNNYYLTISGKFTVARKEISSSNITVLKNAVTDNDGWAYPADAVKVSAVLNGETTELTPAVFDSKGNYISGDYRMISSEKTDEIGNFTFIIEGVGNYSGIGEAIVEVVGGDHYITVKNGTLKGGGTSGYFKYNAVAVVTADKAADGYKFGYWKRNGQTISYNSTYTFFVTFEITKLEAVYLEDTDDIEKYGNAKIESVTPDKENSKIQFVSILNVPDDCKILKAGIVATSDAEKGANLTAENADYVRADETDKHNYKYTWTKTKVTDDQIWYVKGYLVYEDANGNQKTMYSDLTKATLDGSETVIEDKIVGTALMESVNAIPEESKLQFVAMLSVPADCTISKAGIVATSDAEKGANLTAENADFVRADATTKHGYRYTWTKTNVTTDQTWYVRPYLAYTDANGKEFTVYGDLVTEKLCY